MGLSRPGPHSRPSRPSAADEIWEKAWEGEESGQGPEAGLPQTELSTSGLGLCISTHGGEPGGGTALSSTPMSP